MFHDEENSFAFLQLLRLNIEEDSKFEEFEKANAKNKKPAKKK